MALESGARGFLTDLARRLDAAGHGEKTGIKREAMRFLGCSLATLHARLKSEVGWSSGRKTRDDKGRSKILDAHLDLLAATQRESLRRNGKQILYTPDAAQIMEANGVDLPVSNHHLNRLMRARKLNVATQRQAKAVQTLKSLHPNHVHQTDPSLCVLYYMPNGRQAIMEADRFYKNKFENYTKVKFKVWRYVLYDHTSAVLAFRYYEARGESPATLFEFLMWAWCRQENREFHGVPKILMWDKGSANTATAIKALLDGLEVIPIEHKAGAANVKGGVENAQDIIECKFESRLKFEPVHSVEELNAAALAWQNAFNADMIPRQDNRLNRHGMTPTARIDLWRRIVPEQLRICPPIEACRALLAGREEIRKVSRKLAISYRHPAAECVRLYSVAGLDGICAGDEIKVRPMLFGNCAIKISMPRFDGADLIYRLEPEALPDEFGMPEHAPVIGEQYKALPDTLAAKAGKRMDALAYPEQEADQARDKQIAPFGGRLNAHSHLKDIDLPAYLPRQGTALTMPDTVTVAARRLNCVQLAGALAAELAGEWNAGCYQRLTAWYPEGALESDLPEIVERFKGVPRLKAVGT